jgi:cytochrome d ubiquinol oxidase subunit II
MQAFWFGVIAVLWAGFFMLEGFDLGVGMLQPVVARSEVERAQVARSIGPVWDGNEVWLLVAGGATFAAFPAWYASMFSGFYLAFALLLVGLILRGIGIEYRGKAHTTTGRRWCDLAFVVGSLLPALLLGVAFANLLRGLTMNADHVVTSSFISLLSPYALLGGLVTLALFALHGATYLALRTDGPVRERARKLVPAFGVATIALTLALVVLTDRDRGNPLTDAIAAVIVVALVAAIWRTAADRDGHAFVGTSLAALLVPVWVFAALWPEVLPARNNSAWSLTVHNASSSPYTLRVMTVVAVVMTPIVLVYQAWSYWVFRARVTGADAAGGAYGSGRTGGGKVSGTVGTVIDSARRSAAETLGHRKRDPARSDESTSPQ